MTQDEQDGLDYYKRMLKAAHSRIRKLEAAHSRIRKLEAFLAISNPPTATAYPAPVTARWRRERKACVARSLKRMGREK